MMNLWKGTVRRVGATLLACVLLLGLLPQLPRQAGAAYTDSYLQQMVDWGFMRGDISGNLRPDNPISRAEFVTVINRALGYEKLGGDPFQDVPDSAWYAEDVDIAYTEGYISGTSKTTFSPDSSITREEAAIILTRNLMLQPDTGENTSFTDSRELSEWSRGYIATAARYGLVNGYPDGSFRPKNPITRGEAAILVVKAVGTPVQTAGVHSLGSTWGNVTITSSGVTLRDTVVGGNLYITGGVDLGEITLENVTVLGEIVISGGGVSEGGDDSIVLRNVNAPKLIVDNIPNQQISIRVEGDGVIEHTSVRTDAYLDDRTPAGYGLSKIALEGEDGLSLNLAGNVKEVTNLTPKSRIGVASGHVDTINVDEKATDSTLNIASGAEVDNVNLDVATSVTGDGDIGHLTVNAPGSTVTMLPDQITIRPGVEATIDGEKMDSEAAAESSADPRLLAGYPEVTDLAPTSATARFSANKKGTVYWAVTSVTDGSVGVDDLLNPSSYSPKIVKSGTLSLPGSSQPGSVKISGLTSDGSYYLSAVFVDARKERSPLKVISFTTPDNTVPNFASGYPYMSKITSTSGQVTTMATKSCRLYWAVLPKGASAPTANDFKANAVSGNLGFGTLDVTKNVSNTFDVNNVPLEELESYDLYLWLTDVDGGQSSAVKKVSFTTVDGTPPRFNTNPTVNKVNATSVGLYANLNEAGTLYWVVVKEGEEYPKPLAGQSGKVDLSSDNAKLQVSAGMNALKNGKVTMTEGKDVSFTVSGLEKETAYDLYYVAQDKAGNYSETVGKITIHTLDPNAPTVTQEFTKYNGTDSTTPLPNTDVRLVFSEAVQTVDTHTPLVDLYEAVTKAVSQGHEAEMAARDKMALALSNAIYLYLVPSNTQPERLEGATDSSKQSGEWTIDYRYAEITMEDGKTIVKFPNGTGINLRSGAEYYFEIQADSIADTSTAANVMGRTTLDHFKTVFAVVNLSAINENGILEYKDTSEVIQKPAVAIPVDVSWRLSPVSTEAVVESIDWDMLIWTDTSVEFNLYYREVGTSAGTWELLNQAPISIAVPDTVAGYVGVSLTRNFLQSGSNNPDFDALKELKEDTFYEYAISFTKVAGLDKRDTWSQRINLKVHVAAGSNNELSVLSADVTESNWKEALASGVTNIGIPPDFSLRKQFTDNVAPSFIGEYPKFDAGDSAVSMSLMLDRPGTVYYVVAPRGYIETSGGGTDYSGEKGWGTLPEGGSDKNAPPDLTAPDYLSIVNAANNYRNEKIKYGSVGCSSSVEVKLVEDLDKLTQYTVYFVLQGTSQTYSSVLAYRFQTTDVDKPVITLTQYSPSVNFETDSTAELKYALIANNEVPELLRGSNGFDRYVDSGKKAGWDKLTGPGAAYEDTDRTVLWALCTPYGTKGYSIFDEFADDRIRDAVSTLVDGTNSMGATIADQGRMSLDQANKYFQSKDFTERMTGGTLYYCLATAVSPLGSETSFAGVSGVFIPDKTPPVLKNYSTTIESDKDDRYTGTVTFVFDEPIYQLVTKNGVDQKPMEVWQTRYTATGDAVRLDQIIGSAYRSSFSCPNEVKRASSTLTLKFENIPLNTNLVLFDSSFICDANSNSTRQNLTFVLQKTGIGLIDQGEKIEFVQVESRN